MIRLVLLLCAILSSLRPCCAQDLDELLTGTIGSYPIAMNITSYEGSCDGSRYFYQRSKKDIVLDGSLRDKDHIHFEVKAWDTKLSDNVVVESFELHRVANGWDGTWSASGKKLPVVLRNADLSTFAGPYEQFPAIKQLKEAEPFAYLRFKDIQLVRQPDYRHGTATLCDYKEPLSGITLFRLVSGFPDAVIKSVNDSLTNIQLGDVASSLTCASSMGAEYTAEADKELLLTDHVLSVNIVRSYDCGGAHPDFGETGYTYDMHTGRQLSLEDMFWLTGKKPPANVKEDNAYQETLSNSIIKIFTKLYPEEMKVPSDSDEEQCNYSDPTVWEYANWYLTSEGLYLGAYFARVARSCDSPDWSIIPYEDLKQYRNPENKLTIP